MAYSGRAEPLPGSRNCAFFSFSRPISSPALIGDRDQPHANDVLALSRGEDFVDYFIQFVATLNPNGGSNRTIQWPQYDPSARQTLLVLEGEEPLAIGRDDARAEAMKAVAALSFKYPL